MKDVEGKRETLLEKVNRFMKKGIYVWKMVQVEGALKSNDMHKSEVK